MPLRKGSTQSVVSSNIKTLVDEWKKDGWMDRHQPSADQEKSDQAGRCHRNGQGRQKPQYVAAQVQVPVSRSSSHPIPCYLAKTGRG